MSPAPRIESIFATCRESQRAALMPFITAGYPSLDVTEQVLPEVEAAGADIVEIGFPFSDPIADGPVIAASMHEALGRGASPRQIFDLVSRVRHRLRIGLIAMVSDSIVVRMGPSQFITEAAGAGFDGLIIPDIDLDSAASIRAMADEHGMCLSLLVAPNSTPERIERIVAQCSGFVYLLARTGITGERDTPPEVEAQAKRIRNATDLPIAVGFGISKRAHIESVARVADAAIVGSALVRRMGEAEDPVAAARAYIAELAVGSKPAVSR